MSQEGFNVGGRSPPSKLLLLLGRGGDTLVIYLGEEGRSQGGAWLSCGGGGQTRAGAAPSRPPAAAALQETIRVAGWAWVAWATAGPAPG
jgi:hypothetical protein